MKKYLFTLLTAIAIVGTSCQKEEKLIIGTWEATSVSGTITDEDGKVIFSGSFPVFLIDMTINLEFRKNNTYSFFMSFDDKISSEMGTYSVDGNLLFLEGKYAVAIQKIDKKELILDMDIEDNKMAVTFKKI